MAVISRGVKKDYVNEVNKDGVATQLELDTAISEHISNFNHVPDAIESQTGMYLRFDGTNYVWDVAVPGTGEDGLPSKIKEKRAK